MQQPYSTIHTNDSFLLAFIDLAHHSLILIKRDPTTTFDNADDPHILLIL